MNLPQANVHVAIVTAAGYPGEADRFEQRVQGLLAAFRSMNLPQNITDRWRLFALLGTWPRKAPNGHASCGASTFPKIAPAMHGSSAQKITHSSRLLRFASAGVSQAAATFVLQSGNTVELVHSPDRHIFLVLMSNNSRYLIL